MPNRSQVIVVVLAALAVIGVAYHLYWTPEHPAAESSRQDAQPILWTCPMHPQLQRSEKGTCPSCGMPLVKTSSERDSKARSGAPDRAGHVQTDSAIDQIKLRPEDVQRMGITTEAVEERSLSRELEFDGKVELAESHLVKLSSHVAGRIEEMQVNATGQTVTQGNALYSIYSPFLVTAQEEYLLALSNRQKLKPSPYAEVQLNAQDLVEASRKRLSFGGLTEAQIRQIELTGLVKDRISILAPLAGTIITKHVTTGSYVQQGDPVYTVADLSTLWFVAQVPEHEISWIRLGQEVEATVISSPGEVVRGKVTFVDPVVDPQTRTVRVRTEVRNPQGRLKPEMLGRVKARSSPSKPFLTIPSSAVIEASPLPLAYVEKGAGEFAARQIRVGLLTADRAAVLQGLEKGERVVVRGSFFIDSQRQLRRGARVLWESSRELEARKPGQPQAP